MKLESVNILQRNLDELILGYNKTISKCSYGESLNILKNIESITRYLESLDIKIEIDDSVADIKENQYDKWYNVLKFFIETKQPQLIKLDNSSYENQIKHRATGKTSTLVRLSSDYNIPIITDSVHMRILNDRAKELKCNPIIVEAKNIGLTQYRNTDIILVDEVFFIKDTTCYIPKDKIIIGFTN